MDEKKHVNKVWIMIGGALICYGVGYAVGQNNLINSMLRHKVSVVRF